MAKPNHRNALPAAYQLMWYEIDHVLGQGGFGITYLARDTNLDQRVAIKEYLPGDLAVRAQNDRVQAVSSERDVYFHRGLDDFLFEARTLARFDHPAIVRVHSVFEANGTAYMVMRYEDGQSLSGLLPRRGTLPERDLRSVLYPILEGLELVHEAGFIHRDIKPSNVFVREDGSPVLLDFGSARRAVGDGPGTMTAVFTRGFAPFEQYHGRAQQQGPWTDIYGLAATVYRAMLGVAPVDAMDRSEGLLREHRDPIVPAFEAAAGRYGRQLLRAIDVALAFRHEDRPQSVAEWRQRLPAFDEDLAEEPVIRPAFITPLPTIEILDDPDESELALGLNEMGLHETGVLDSARPTPAIDAMPDAIPREPSAFACAPLMQSERFASAAPEPPAGSEELRDPLDGLSPNPEETPLIALLSSFVGEKGRGYYLERFLMWRQTGNVPWLSWNPAGLSGPLWFLRRRMRLWGLCIHPLLASAAATVLVVIGSLLFFGDDGMPWPVAALVFLAVLFVPPALYGNRVYFRHVNRHVDLALEQFDTTIERRDWLARTGGPSWRAPLAGLLVLLVVVVVVIVATGMMQAYLRWSDDAAYSSVPPNPTTPISPFTPVTPATPVWQWAVELDAGPAGLDWRLCMYNSRRTSPRCWQPIPMPRFEAPDPHISAEIDDVDLPLVVGSLSAGDATQAAA